MQRNKDFYFVYWLAGNDALDRWTVETVEDSRACYILHLLEIRCITEYLRCIDKRKFLYFDDG